MLATLLLKDASAPNRAASACFGVSPRYRCKHVLFIVQLFYPVFSSSGQFGEFSIAAPEKRLVNRQGNLHQYTQQHS